MMQAADARQRDETRRLARLGGNRPHCRCVFLKRVMDPVRMIIEDVSADQTTQMSFIEDDHVIEKLSATASDPAFGNPIGLSSRQRCIVTLRIESSKLHTPFIHSTDALSSW